MLFLSEITAWHWWIFTLVLLILELMVPGAFFLWLAIASSLVGGITWFIPTLGIVYHLVLFSICSVAAVILYFRHQSEKQVLQALNRRAEQYIGRIITLESPIENGRGRVRLGDTLWIIEGPDCTYGTTVKVVATDGSILRVEIIKSRI